MKILLVHGIGHADQDPNYYDSWIETINASLHRAGLTSNHQYVRFHYDDLFEEHYSGPGTYTAALAEFLATATWHWITDPITNLFRPSRGFPNPYGESDFRWKAGMVAQLAVEDGLRRELRQRLAKALTPTNGDQTFDMLAAHSLGTLISYDFFRHEPGAANLLQQGIFLTFGSQINNDFARNRLFPGPIQMPNVRSWYHLFNDHDPVLTAPIRLSDPRFRQISTPSAAGHSPIAIPNDGPGYLDHPNTQSEFWNVIATKVGARGILKSATAKGTMRAPRRLLEKPSRRALIIGINNYPDPANHLDGCVNDAFRVSEVLQERGFQPQNIRLLLDDRATANAIRERLAWLLYRAEDGMERVLFYSGHGAQIPGKNGFEEIDHVDECLVPFDFAWTDETAITDKDFYRLYSDLPYGARFFAMFDCCHSGGLTRSGARKARAIDPPDDVRHRMMKWNPKRKMWVERKLPPINADFGGKRGEKQAYMGKNLATFKLGRAMRLRRLPVSKYHSLDKDCRGPFLPVLLEACAEGQLAYEYRHGVTSYGAFTYSVTEALRDNREITFRELINKANNVLQNTLKYDQTAQLIGPAKVIGHAVPGGNGGKKAGPRKRKR